MFPPVALGICGTAVLFFLQKACTSLHRYAGRDEVRRLTSDSASAFKKKDDVAYTCAKFVHLLCEGPRKVRRRKRKQEDGMREKEQVIARRNQFLERSRSVKAQVEALEALLGPEDVDVDLRRILKRSERSRKGARSSKPSAQTT